MLIAKIKDLYCLIGLAGSCLSGVKKKIFS